MKVRIYALHLGVGGVETYVAELANILSENYSVEVVATYKMPVNLEYKINERVKIHYLTQAYPTHHNLKRLCQSKKYLTFMKTIIFNCFLLMKKYVCNIKSVLKNDAHVIITTRIFHNKIVNKFSKDAIKISTEHNDYHDNYDYINNVLKSITNFDYLLPISPSLAEKYENLNKNTNLNVYYIPFFIDSGHDSSIIDGCIDKKKHKVIFVGRLEEEKGFIESIEAFRSINDYDHRYEFHIFGEGNLLEDNEVIELLNEKKDKIIIHGFVNKKILFEHFLTSDYILITSQRESFGIAALEAMSYGIIPLVLSTASGVVDNLEGFEKLIGNNIGDLFSTFTSLQKLPDNKVSLRKKLVKRSREFNRDNTKRRFQKLFNEIEGEL